MAENEENIVVDTEVQLETDRDLQDGGAQKIEEDSKQKVVYAEEGNGITGLRNEDYHVTWVSTKLPKTTGYLLKAWRFCCWPLLSIFVIIRLIMGGLARDFDCVVGEGQEEAFYYKDQEALDAMGDSDAEFTNVTGWQQLICWIAAITLLIITIAYIVLQVKKYNYAMLMEYLQPAKYSKSEEKLAEEDPINLKACKPWKCVYWCFCMLVLLTAISLILMITTMFTSSTMVCVNGVSQLDAQIVDPYTTNGNRRTSSDYKVKYRSYALVSRNIYARHAKSVTAKNKLEKAKDVWTAEDNDYTKRKEEYAPTVCALAYRYFLINRVRNFNESTKLQFESAKNDRDARYNRTKVGGEFPNKTEADILKWSTQPNNAGWFRDRCVRTENKTLATKRWTNARTVYRYSENTRPRIDKEFELSTKARDYENADDGVNKFRHYGYAHATGFEKYYHDDQWITFFIFIGFFIITMINFVGWVEYLCCPCIMCKEKCGSKKQES